MFPPVPLPLLTDSYKASHFNLYPPGIEQAVAYAEFRQSFDKDPEDHRIVFYGIRYLIETYIARQWTRQDLEETERFFSTHNVGNTAYPFPKALYEKILTDHNGYFPVKIESLAEGSVVYPHVPVYQITATGEFSPLCTYLETLLTMIWYPCTVATLSRRCRALIETAFEKSVDAEGMSLIESRLHDFGFRGCTSVEQSMIGGAAHLLNFTGTDTLSAAYHVQKHLNPSKDYPLGGTPIGQSIPATEHSVMTAWPTEKEAILNHLEQYGSGVLACVLDSYDYAQALERLLPVVASKKLEKGGFLVMRPDSGDPIETVLMALRAGEKVFGVTVNKKGYKVLKGCGVIQGDGVNYQTISRILDESMKLGFSAQNIAFGMGGGLLQKVNRDTMSFATKLCSLRYQDGTEREIMKTPKTDKSKFSLPGALTVIETKHLPIVHPKQPSTTQHKDNIFHTVYDHGKVCDWDTFTTVRNRVQQQWNRLPPIAQVLSQELSEKVKRVQQEQADRTAHMLSTV